MDMLVPIMMIGGFLTACLATLWGAWLLFKRGARAVPPVCCRVFIFPPGTVFGSRRQIRPCWP